MTTYITTPIYYVNAMPHLGHAYTTIVADTYARFRRLCDTAVRFQTGTDEHGEKIAEAAAAEGISPKAFVDRISAAFFTTWPHLSIAQDATIRTTDPAHIKVVQQILQQVYEQGDIYFDAYTGLYCQGCERFLTEKELIDGNCPDHQKPPVPITEQNYFFRMSKYQDWLIEHIKANPEFITPERYRNEVLSFLSEPLEDLCISRPVARLTWGIPLPFDNKFVTYVWFDALINYLSGLGYPGSADFATYWPVAEHVIAKDILKPHAIFWPTMLRAMGLAPYRRLHVHGYWNVDAAKMSKSVGNVIRPLALVEQYGVDTVRYFVLREMRFGLDSSFSGEAIVGRQNADLANDLGNLFSRSLTMIAKYSDNVVPMADQGSLSPAESELRDAAAGMLAEYRAAMDDFEFHRGLQAVWELIGLLNRYVVTNAPWELAKDPAQAGRLRTVLYHLAEGLRIVALVLGPVMPQAAGKMATALGLGAEMTTANLDDAAWGGLKDGTRIRLGEPLFPRLEKKPGVPSQAKEPVLKKPVKKEQPPPGVADNEGLLPFEQFGQVDLRVAEVVAAEPVAKSDRLLKLTLRAPEERTVVAGIAKYYQPAELLGQLVIIVANLKPAKLMGITSQGMVLAAKEKDAEGNERLVLSTVSGPVAPGSRVG